MIPDTLQRLQTTGQDAMKLMEESKDGDVSKVNRGRVNDWCALAVNISIEYLDMPEKIRVLTAAMSEANEKWSGSPRNR